MNFSLTSECEAAQVLAGDWLVRAAGHGEWRTVADQGLDDSGWDTTSMPGRCWLDAGNSNQSTVLYRRHFELPAGFGDGSSDVGDDDPANLATPANDTRWWLVVSGLCELGHLWLDGTYLGDLRGRHATHAFEVGELLRTSPEHLAAVEAADGALRSAQDENASVQIERTGPARIQRVRALVIEADGDRAVLRIAATVDSAGTRRAEVTTTVLVIEQAGAQGLDARRPEQGPVRDASLGDRLAVSDPVLARGRNELEWLVPVEQPALWWPAGMGDQPLYRISIDLAINGQTSHAVRLHTGIRTTALRRRKLFVNGESCDAGLADLTETQDQLAHRSFYEEFDQAGKVLCQQITLDPRVFAGAERGARALAARAAASAVDHAGHHPSVVAWQLVLPPAGAQWPRAFRRWRHRSMAAAMRAADPTRPFLPHDHLG